MKLTLLTENRQEGFIQAIRENPNDWGIKLQYAHWLEDHGDPLGEAIQLTYQLISLPDPPETGTLVDPLWSTSNEYNYWEKLVDSTLQKAQQYKAYIDQNRIEDLARRIVKYYPDEEQGHHPRLVNFGQAISHSQITEIFRKAQSIADEAAPVIDYHARIIDAISGQFYDWRSTSPFIELPINITALKPKLDKIKELSKWADKFYKDFVGKTYFTMNGALPYYSQMGGWVYDET